MEVITLASNDVERFIKCGCFLFYFAELPFEVLLTLLMLWRLVGAASLAGFAVILLVIPAQYFVSVQFGRQRAKTAVATDARVRSTSQMLGGAQLMKMQVRQNH